MKACMHPNVQRYQRGHAQSTAQRINRLRSSVLGWNGLSASATISASAFPNPVGHAVALPVSGFANCMKLMLLDGKR
jgi:hypothetical protein